MGSRRRQWWGHLVVLYARREVKEEKLERELVRRVVVRVRIRRAVGRERAIRAARRGIIEVDVRESGAAALPPRIGGHGRIHAKIVGVIDAVDVARVQPWG